MKRKATHLPEIKQAELDIITQVIREKASVYMVLLFGSYARGDYVEDIYIENHITYEYKSDYDILVVLKPDNTRRERVEEVVTTAINADTRITTPVNVIFHSIEFLNKKIDSAEYFFSDIKKECSVLYDSEEVKLAKFRTLRNAERQRLAQEDYDYWFEKAEKFYKYYTIAFNEKDYVEGSFLLHQAAEHLYTTVLLVYTHYKPKLHDLEKLASQIASIDPVFINAIPNTTPEEKLHFEILKKAYIGARYKKEFTVSEKELLYLGKNVKVFKDLVEKMCVEKIAEFGEKFTK